MEFSFSASFIPAVKPSQRPLIAVTASPTTGRNFKPLRAAPATLANPVFFFGSAVNLPPGPLPTVGTPFLGPPKINFFSTGNPVAASNDAPKPATAVIIVFPRLARDERKPPPFFFSPDSAASLSPTS